MTRELYVKLGSKCNCMNIRQASLAITHVYNGFLAPSGLLISQYSVLKHINHLGPISVSNLAVKMKLDRTSLVRNLKLLEDRGFILDLAASGARNRQLKLTDAGATSLAIAEPFWLEAQNYLEQYLGIDDRKTLTSLLLKIMALVP